MASQNDQPHITVMGHCFDHKPTISMKIILLAFVRKNARHIKGNITKYIAPKTILWGNRNLAN